MAFKNLMTGGACQPDGQQTGVSQNAFTNLLDNFITGDAMGRQMAEGYGPQQQWNTQNMQFLEQQYQQMMNQNLMNQQFEQMRLQDQMMPNQSMQTNYFQHLAERPQTQMELNSLWDSIGQEGVQQVKQPEGMQQNFAQPWMNPMQMSPMFQPNMFSGPMFQPQQQQVPLEKPGVQVEEVKDKIQDMINEEVKQTSNSMIEVLSKSQDPRHRNSKFLKFLKKLSHGAYTIENDNLVKHQEKIQEFKGIEDQRVREDMERQKRDEQAKIDEKQKMFSRLWNNEDNLNEEEYNEMMQKWEEENMDDQFNNMFMEEWGKQWQKSEEPVVETKVIPMEENNKYLETESRVELAKHLIEEGRAQEAIVCLQAEVQKNQENAEAWRLMGQLYQENDQDDYAIIAFKKAYEIDPFDLDSLLCLGISCTNELEQKEAINHLHNWLKYHPDFSTLPNIQADKLDFEDVRAAFLQAHALKPKDSNVALALGVLSFIQRDFVAAGKFFESGIRENPTDHTLWNKYGAARANNLEIDKAIQIYKQALDLRPNYVRTMANIGLAYRNIGEFEKSIPYFLNSLLLNPQAKHIWNYARNSFLQMGRLDFVEKMNFKDPNMFRDDFPLINPSQLPKQNLDRLYENEIWHQ